MRRTDTLPPEEGARWALRSLVVGFFLLSGVAILGARAAYLMLLSGDDFARASRSNAIKEIVLHPPRGVILDAHGEILATNRPSFDCVFLPLGTDPREDPVRARRFSEVLGVPEDEIRAALREGRKTPFRAVSLIEGLAEEPARALRVRIGERRSTLEGLSLEPRPHRFVAMGAALGHLLGYLSEVTPQEMDGDPSGHRMGDRVGRAGVERALDDVLAGTKGKSTVEVDARGQVVRTIQEIAPVPGSEVTLTIRAELQRAAADSMAGLEGAVVAIEPTTGRLLAFHSAPSFDPNVFLDPTRQAERRALLSDTVHKPTYNRALLASYPPGSTFKVGVLSAAWDTIRPDWRILCEGSYRGQGCWKKTGHGWISMRSGLVNSCDVYFYRVGEELGNEALVPVVRGLGLGRPPGLDFGPEGSGVVPTPEWERENVNPLERWGDGDNRNTAIGQGYVLVTPTQLARMMASVAAGGRRYRLQVVEKVRDPSGRVVRSFQPELEEDLGWSEEKRHFLLDALEGVVAEGTGTRARIEGLRVGGKTGTAQNAHGEDHAWFICAAPIEDPKIAVAVLVVHGAHGSTAAAPIARRILEVWARAEGRL